MSDHDIIVIGASAGGVETLIQLCKRLPANLSAATFIVLHLSSTTPSVLPRILSRAGKIPAVHPQDGEEIRPGKIYIAPSDYHLELLNSVIHLSHGPSENGYRPSIDVLFRTAALTYGPRVIGIILSGMLSDGTLGLQAIHEHGGMAIVQDPNEALFPSMPRNALRNVEVDAVLPLEGIAKEIVQQVVSPVNAKFMDPRQVQESMEQVIEDKKAFRNDKDISPRTLITCPACGGVLWELHEGQQTYFLCQVGHRYSQESLYQEQKNGVESVLWAAVRLLEERAALSHRIAEKIAIKNASHTYTQFISAAEKAEQDAQAIRQILEQSKWFNLTDNLGDEAEPNA